MLKPLASKQSGKYQQLMRHILPSAVGGDQNRALTKSIGLRHNSESMLMSAGLANRLFANRFSTAIQEIY